MGENRVPLVGLMGGIASGKSFVAGQLERKGAAVVSADRWAHEVLKFDDVKQAIRRRWGEGVIAASGEVDRPAVGRIVFAPGPDGPREREFLEHLTHPKIGQLIRQQLARLAEEASPPAIVLDVPLLIERGWNEICDQVLFVDAPVAVRQARAVARGWTPEDFARREAVQESLETKRSRADVIIDNSGSPEATAAQIERFWNSLLAAPAKNFPSSPSPEAG